MHSPRTPLSQRDPWQGLTLSAPYLLTFDYRLWFRWRAAFDEQPVDWRAARYDDPDWDA
jgi:hypothetical protein